METHAFCSNCQQESAIDHDGLCLWCGGPTGGKRIKKAGRPPGKYGLIRDEQLRTLHQMHQQGLAIRELGRRIWKVAGYSSQKSAAMAISDGFKRLALPARDQSEATGRANRERADPDSPSTADRAEYKRWLRKKQGGLRPCQGIKLTYPEKGRPCAHYAAPGSDFCVHHDPARRQEILDRVARARAGLKRPDDKEEGS